MEQEKITKKESVFKKPWVQSLSGLVGAIVLVIVFIAWELQANTISIENSQVQAPIINLSAPSAGILNAVYVQEGGHIEANTPVALVGSTIVSSKVSGTVVSIQNTLGALYNPGQTVVSMIHPEDLEVVGQIEENKGLKDITPGQTASFTIDAFGSKTYQGTVDSVSQTSDDTTITFSISDKRPTKKFDIKVRFDTTAYPEIKNGMSAKITIYPNK
ncbi:MAG: HlyD family efflux transporter periplasmic adaptor subunit [bacterium]